MRASSFRWCPSGSFGLVAVFVVIALATDVPAQQTNAAKGPPAEAPSLLETLRNALSSPATQRKAGTGDDDPAAHALYDRMVRVGKPISRAGGAPGCCSLHRACGSVLGRHDAVLLR